jgi:hypothetical protein
MAAILISSAEKNPLAPETWKKSLLPVLHVRARLRPSSAIGLFVRSCVAVKKRANKWREKKMKLICMRNFAPFPYELAALVENKGGTFPAVC